MDRTEKIVNAIKLGKKPTEVSSTLGKDDFTPAEQDKLVGHVSDLWDTPFSYPLLQTMYLISRDEWYRLKVLSLTAQHPSQTGKNRAELLTNLEKILTNLKAVTPEQKHTWTRCQAIYLGIQALTFTEVGNLTKALQIYKMALEKYQQIGLTNPAARVQAIIVNLQSRMMTREINLDEISETLSPTNVAEPSPQDQSNETYSSPIQAEAVKKPEEPAISQAVETKSEQVQPPGNDKTPGTANEQSGEAPLSQELMYSNENTDRQTNEQNELVAPSKEKEQPEIETTEQVPSQIYEYNEQLDKPTTKNVKGEAVLQQSSEFPSKQNTSLETIRTIQEIRDEIEQLNAQNKLIRSNIEELQQKFDEQFRLIAEKLLELVDLQFKTERHIHLLEKKVTVLAEQE